MATRCPRCQKKDISLETFGVYRCPACGRIDADGNMLDIAAPPPDVPPAERVSFAPPPPKEWVPPGASAAPKIELSAATSDGPPTYLLAGVGLMGFATLASALSTGSWMGAILRFGTLAALATGKPWARNLSIVGSGLTVLVILMALAVLRSRLPPAATPVLTVAMLLEGAWLYVMFRPDTVRYFSRTR